MNMSITKYFKTLLIATIVLSFSVNQVVQAGIISKPFIWLSKKAAKKAVTSSIKAVGKNQFQKELEYIARKYGEDVVQKIDRVALHTGIPKEQLAHELRYYGGHYKRAGFSDEAFEFGLKYGEAGRFFISRQELFMALKKSGCLANGNDKNIRESWRLVRVNGGSWKELRKHLTQAGMNSGVSRDYCEVLFANRVKAGRMPDYFPKGTILFSGHITNVADEGSAGNEVRQGIDFLLPQKNGPLKVIEFGTGKKPISMDELKWERIRNNLANYVENAPNKDQLRAAGMPPELLNPLKLRDRQFPIEKYVDREIYAPEIDRSLVMKLGYQTQGNIKAVELP